MLFQKLQKKREYLTACALNNCIGVLTKILHKSK